MFNIPMKGRRIKVMGYIYKIPGLLQMPINYFKFKIIYLRLLLRKRTSGVVASKILAASSANFSL